MRDVLVHVTRFDAWSNSVHYAGQLAGLLKASLSGLYCMEPKASATGASADGMATARVPGPDSDIELARAVEASFGSYMASLGVKHSAWVVHPGSVAHALPHLARWHDLVVLGADASAPHMEPVLSDSSTRGCHVWSCPKRGRVGCVRHASRSPGMALVPFH